MAPAGPLTVVQTPEPTVAVFPARLILEPIQVLKSVPAFAVVATCVTVI